MSAWLTALATERGTVCQCVNFWWYSCLDFDMLSNSKEKHYGISFLKQVWSNYWSRKHLLWCVQNKVLQKCSIYWALTLSAPYTKMMCWAANLHLPVRLLLNTTPITHRTAPIWPCILAGRAMVICSRGCGFKYLRGERFFSSFFLSFLGLLLRSYHLKYLQSTSTYHTKTTSHLQIACSSLQQWELSKSQFDRAQCFAQ